MTTCLCVCIKLHKYFFIEWELLEGRIFKFLADMISWMTAGPDEPLAADVTPPPGPYRRKEEGNLSTRKEHL